jgi:hypothetical protein
VSLGPTYVQILSQELIDSKIYPQGNKDMFERHFEILEVAVGHNNKKK